MNKWLLLVVLLALPFSSVEGQRPVNIQIKLPAPSLYARDAPFISVTNILITKDEEDLIRKGFPAKLAFTAELWPASSLVGRSLAGTQWSVIVDYEPLTKVFRVVRFRPPNEFQELGSYTGFSSVTALLARPYQPRLRAPLQAGRYFYSVNLEVERMTDNDLAEMRSWLGTAMQPERSAGGAIVSFVGSLVKRLIGAQKRVYAGKSEVFEVAGETND